MLYQQFFNFLFFIFELNEKDIKIPIQFTTLGTSMEES